MYAIDNGRSCSPSKLAAACKCATSGREARQQLLLRVGTSVAAGGDEVGCQLRAAGAAKAAQDALRRPAAVSAVAVANATAAVLIIRPAPRPTFSNLQDRSTLKLVSFWHGLMACFVSDIPVTGVPCSQ